MTQTMLEPDRDQIEIFVDAIFRHAKAGFVSLRAFYEGEDKVFRIEPVPTNATNFYKYLCDVAEDIARRAAQDPKPVVFCPPLATFKEKKGAAEADLVEGYTLVGRMRREPGSRTREARAAARSGHRHGALRRHLAKQRRAPTTSCICTGGSREPASSKEQLAKLKRAREIACHLVGADPTTAPVCHPLRWPGSWHRKADAAAVRDHRRGVGLRPRDRSRRGVDRRSSRSRRLQCRRTPMARLVRARTGTSMSATSCAGSNCISRSPSWR